MAARRSRSPSTASSCTVEPLVGSARRRGRGRLQPVYARRSPSLSPMPSKSANVENEHQYEALQDKRIFEQRAAKIVNSPKASKHGGEKSHSGSVKPDQG